MQSSIVVERFDAREDALGGLFDVPIREVKGALSLERAKERFHCRVLFASLSSLRSSVVVAVALGVPARECSRLPECILECIACIGAASVPVDDESLGRLAYAQGFLERTQAKIGNRCFGKGSSSARSGCSGPW